jgi:hypothetical protein
MPGWTKARQATLILAGAWRDEGDAIVLPDYLVWNDNRAHVEYRRQVAAENASKPRPEATAERPRNELGQFEPTAEREDIAAYRERWHKAPTAGQRKVLDDVLRRHDVTGPKWAADIIRANPDDPIGAVLEADKAWRLERGTAADADEKASAERHQRRKDPLLEEIAAAVAERYREPAVGAA